MKEVQQHRRKFLWTGLGGFCAAVLAHLPQFVIARSSSKIDKGIVVRENEGTHLLTRRKVPITIKLSRAREGMDDISFCVEEQSPGRKMRVHKHLNNDELIFIHRGEGMLTLGEGVIPIKTGDVAFVPRGTWHGLDNTGNENLLMIFQYTPAGFEEYFMENGMLAGEPDKVRTEEEYAAAELKYGMVYKEPARK
jgi:mannose-6-phosphate isomerase-like protein (cupin superfamily)